MLDTATIRPQFPILETSVHGKPLIYLDNAATTQKPLAVLNAIRHYYDTENANVHRGSHYLSQLATEAHEESRKTVARFINAPETAEVLFTSGCTMGINLAADTIAGSGMVKPGDEVIVTASEHHSNIVPWQMLCERTGAVLKAVPLTPGQTLDMEAYRNMLSPRTRIVAVGHVSNTLGTVNPVREMAALAKENRQETIVLIDGAQAVSHMNVDVQELGCDLTKVFPAGNVGGPSFVKNVKAPLPWSNIMATGAVEPTEENLTAWFKAGVYCVGMGSQLFPKEVVAVKDWAAITEKCRFALDVIARVR